MIKYMKKLNFLIELFLLFGLGKLSDGKHFVKTSLTTSSKHSSSRVSVNMASLPVRKQRRTLDKCGSTSKLSKDLKNSLFYLKIKCLKIKSYDKSLSLFIFYFKIPFCVGIKLKFNIVTPQNL